MRSVASMYYLVKMSVVVARTEKMFKTLLI